jgi:hypothetical protein
LVEKKQTSGQIIQKPQCKKCSGVTAEEMDFLQSSGKATLGKYYILKNVVLAKQSGDDVGERNNDSRFSLFYARAEQLYTHPDNTRADMLLLDFYSRNRLQVNRQYYPASAVILSIPPRAKSAGLRPALPAKRSANCRRKK